MMSYMSMFWNTNTPVLLHDGIRKGDKKIFLQCNANNFYRGDALRLFIITFFCHFVPDFLFFIFLFNFIFKVGSMPNMEHELITLRSQVECSTDWASQVQLSLIIYRKYPNLSKPLSLYWWWALSTLPSFSGSQINLVAC